MKLFTLLFLICFTGLTSCSGQNIPQSSESKATITSGDTVNELSKSIWIVFQADNNNFWYGSDSSGVYCYDGKTLINFSTKNGLSSNRVREIQEDKKGNVYITTLEGIYKYDGHSLTELIPIKSNSYNENWKLQKDDLWFNTLGKSGEEGPLRYDGKNLFQLKFPKHYLADDYFERFPNNAWSPYDVYYIYKDKKGDMWFGTSDFGICRYDGKTLSWLYEDHLTNVPGGGSFGIRSILEDSKGKFWFCNSRYRYKIYKDSIVNKGTTLIKYKKEKGIKGIKAASGSDHIYYLSIVEDNSGDLWLATFKEGIWRYDGKKVTHYPVKDGNKDITVFSIYKDKKGELWLGTHDSGVYKFNGNTFEKFTL